MKVNMDMNMNMNTMNTILVYMINKILNVSKVLTQKTAAIDIIEAEERILKIFKYKHLNDEPIKIPNYTRYLINSAHLREEGFSWYLN